MHVLGKVNKCSLSFCVCYFFSPALTWSLQSAIGAGPLQEAVIETVGKCVLCFLCCGEGPV